MPAFRKIFKKLIFKSLFEYLDESKWLSKQPGFRPNDSWLNPLLSIVHDIYTAFDADLTLEVRGVLLDMSKPFDKVDMRNIIYNPRQGDISGEALALINSFLNIRFQYVKINVRSSNWLPVKSSVWQGSILGPLFFLVYIHDLSDKITSTAKLFADDTSFFSVVNDPNISANELNKDLISEWA